MQTTFRGRSGSLSAPMAALAALAVVVLVGGLFLSRLSDPGIGTQPTPSPTATASGSSSPSVTPALSPTALQFEAIPVGAPLVVATNSDAAWASSMADGVIRIDLETNETTVIPLPEEPSDLRGIAATDDAVWQTDLGRSVVYRIDPATNEVVASIQTPGLPVQPYPAGDVVYVAMETGGVNVIDVDTNELLEPVDAHGTVAFGSAWLAGTPEGAVSRYEFDTGRVTEIEVPPPSATCDAYPISGVEGIDDSIVVGCRGLSYLSRIDVATNELAGTYRVGTTHAISVAAAGGWWAIINDQLARIDPATGTVIDVRDLQGNVPTPVHSTVATSANDLWIASERTEQVIRIPFSELEAP